MEATLGGIPVNVEAVWTHPLDTDRSTADTIQVMRRLALRGAKTPQVQVYCQGLETLSPRETVGALYRRVKQTLRFREDESISVELGHRVDAEVVTAPEALLSMPIPEGDCDDYSTLLAACLLASDPYTGVSFGTLAVDEEDPYRWSHVYVVAYVDGERIPLDASHGPYVGWEKDTAYRRREWPIRKESKRMMVATPGLEGWADIAQTGVQTAYQTAADILKAQYGGLQPGTYTQQGSNIAYRVPEGSTLGVFPSLSTGGMSVTTIMLIAAGLVALVMVSRR